ncbi:hypothetical protein [Rubinisphaera margarita]|uniref:hypothetical protein n=1 Tax=Rubinisphaera margarita TaxID=2909586 RepID=UPI001EE99A6C|nr:hypothetical protein [Rubinisphaera margarita]MCG6156888.1 hypothetical protein [Rubinisphaera margarita]
MSAQETDDQIRQNSSPEAETGTESEQHIPDASQLEDRFPEWARLSRSTTIWVCIVGLIYAVLSYHPLWHTDLWGHLSYGRYIVQQGEIPTTEPLLPLCQGMPFVDTAWLSQVIAYFGYQELGVTALRFLFAFSLTVCVIALIARFRSRTDSFGISLIGLAIFGVVAMKSLSIVRPQLAGLACFVVIWTLLTCRRWTALQWVGIPLTFMAWVNLHGSFPMGLALLGLYWLGKTADELLRKRRLSIAGSIRYLLVLELSLMAVLINPYGIGIFPAVQEIAGNPNFAYLVEWDPLTLRIFHGKAMAVTAILLLVLYRLTPRRISLAEPLLLIVFGLASMWSVRFLVWWTPLAAWYAVLHGSAVLNHFARHRRDVSVETSLQKKAGLNTVVAVGMTWIFFAYTPFAATLLHGYPTDPDKAFEFYRSNLSRDTPVLLAQYLTEHEPRGLIFNSYEWGDYLLWTGPEDRQLFLNSHAHLVPRDVWLDYFVIARGTDGWDDKLDRYGVNAVVVDKLYRERLINLLRRDEGWRLEYEDELGAIFLREKPILTGPLVVN